METDNKFERYQRQMQLPEIGLKGQKKIQRAKILLIGAGGLGSSAAFYLAAAGVGIIGIVDNDIVEKSNLNRQILHTHENFGKFKVDSARQILEKFNPDIDIKTYQYRFSSENELEKIINDYDILLDCTDNYKIRYLINQACINQKTTWIYGAVSEFEGQVMTIIPGKTACYRCLYPASPSLSNKAAAVIGITPGLTGILQAAEALKYILNIKGLLTNRLLYFDLLEMHFDSVKTTKNNECAACRHISNP